MAAATSGTEGGAGVGSGSALAERKKEKQTPAKRGRPKRQRVAKDAEQDARRLEVARLLIAHKSYREIVVALEQLPPERRPKNVSLATVSRDVAALRAEWVEERSGLVQELVAEELERLRLLEGVWWPDALLKDKDATDKVLAIQRQRMALMGIGGSRGAVQVTAGAAAGTTGGVNTEGPLPAGAQVKVLVEYVDDRRDL